MQLYYSLTFIIIAGIAVQGCISSGDDENRQAERALELKSREPSQVLNEKFIESYLKTFGYFKDIIPKKFDKDSALVRALKSFQSFMSIPSTGEVDAQTSALMTKKRCGNQDVYNINDTIALWSKSILTWNITHFPKTVEEKDLREQLQMAFSAWETVIPMDFVEVHRADKADIVFSFEDEETDWQSDPTHLTIARASGPVSSRVWISANEHWGTNNELDQTRTDLFNVLVHEIGHVLGMRHSPDAKSMMHPLFERGANQERPEVTSDDVERLRNNYNLANLGTEGSELFDRLDNYTFTSLDCPRYIQSAVNAPDGRWLVFKEDKVWQVYNRSVITPPVEIFQVLPSAPTYVNASASFGSLIVLISDRQIFGYTQTEVNGPFEIAKDYPKILHSRVLFYPEAAFPLSNGSIILLNDNVFATYDLEANVPTFLNDKNTYFPNLPENLVSGIPQAAGTDDHYWMLTQTTAYNYDARIQQVSDSESLATFFVCDF